MHRHAFSEHPIRFRDRAHAGRILAQNLDRFTVHDRDLLVLALPRGGVPVGVQVAEYLSAPLDVITVRKVGVPWRPELAAAAIADDVLVRNEDVIRKARIDPVALRDAIARERVELRRRNLAYRADRPPVPVRGKTVIVVDDGIATGATMRAALTALRTLGAAELVAAVPVGPADTLADLRTEVEVVCPSSVTHFYGVGASYDHFDQLSDDDVRLSLAGARRHRYPGS
ncbi:phosphoribosyltransferase [Gordonia sp. NPDC003376]